MNFSSLSRESFNYILDIIRSTGYEIKDVSIKGVSKNILMGIQRKGVPYVAKFVDHFEFEIVSYIYSIMIPDCYGLISIPSSFIYFGDGKYLMIIEYDGSGIFPNNVNEKKVVLFTFAMSLVCLHSFDIIHSDIKDENYFGEIYYKRDEKGRAKEVYTITARLGDFGMTGTEDGKIGMGMAGVETVPPELDYQDRKMHETSKATDIFGLGMIALQYITGVSAKQLFHNAGYKFGKKQEQVQMVLNTVKERPEFGIVAYEFLFSMLRSKEKRATIMEVINHSFFDSLRKTNPDLIERAKKIVNEILKAKQPNLDPAEFAPGPKQKNKPPKPQREREPKRVPFRDVSRHNNSGEIVKKVETKGDRARKKLPQKPIAKKPDRR